jgi:hypothetical protein
MVGERGGNRTHDPLIKSLTIAGFQEFLSISPQSKMDTNGGAQATYSLPEIDSDGLIVLTIRLP